MAKEKDMREVVGKGFPIQTILFVFLFIVGLLVGIYIEYQLENNPLSPFTQTEEGSLALCKTKLSIQDKQIASYIACMQEKGIDINACT